MFELPYNAGSGHGRFMTNESAMKSRAVKYGKALLRLRQSAKVTQAGLASMTGLTQQAINRYEKGSSSAFLNKASLQAQVLTPLGFTIGDLEKVVDGPDEGVGSIFSIPRPMVSASASEKVFLDLQSLLTEGAKMLQIETEDVVPYVEPGGFVVYNTKMVARGNRFVVAEMTSGELLPRKYVRTTPSHVELIRYEQVTHDGRIAYVEILEAVPLIEIRRPHPIVLRGD